MDIEISRVNRTKAEARSNYNRLSRWYDWISGSSEEKFRRIGVRVLDLQKGEKVLEIGFGTGQCLLPFGVSVGESSWVAGVDLSDGMVQIAQTRISQNRLKEQIALCLADGVDLPFCPSYFNAVFMSFTLELFDTHDIQRVLRQCHRVLTPSGRLVNVSLSKSVKPGIAEQLYEWFHSKMPILIDCRPIHAQRSLLSAGFQIIDRVQMKMWGLPVEIISAAKKVS